MNSDRMQLELIRESIYEPGKAEKAKELLLREIYREVGDNYRGRASNGARLVDPRIPDEADYGFTYNAIRVLMSRYLARDEYGRIVETPSSLMRRVAKGFEDRVNPLLLAELLLSRRFMFNSPTLFNMYADGAHGTLSACYVTPVYDSLEEIMEAARVQALTFKGGGGQGFSFSNLRPRWSMVRGTGSFSSGPVSFMTIFDRVTDAVKQGGKRRGANMGVMHDWHADLYNPFFNHWDAYRYLLPQYARHVATGVKGDLESEGCRVGEDFDRHVTGNITPPEEAGFIQAKRFPLGDLFLTNFNISVGVHDAFFVSLFEGREWWLINPQLTGEVSPGDYKVSYAVSRATGMGILGEFLDRVETPYISILEEMVERVRREASRILRETGMSWDAKNPYAWRIPTGDLWREIVASAWSTGDPGMLFLDNYNKWNPTLWLGSIGTTNPCGEQYLYYFESCNLGSMSVDKYVVGSTFDVERFYSDLQVVMDAMDAVIDKNVHPHENHHKANSLTRKVGIGIMGLADMLSSLGIPYDSEEAVAVTLILMAAVDVFAWKRSWELGATLGPAPAFKCKVFDWRRMECVKPGDPGEILEMHVPALRKAAGVMRFEDGWVKVKYHDVRVPAGLFDGLKTVAYERVEPDGTVRLVREEALETVACRVFGITREMADTALTKPVEEVVGDPKLLLALAVWHPGEAWRVLSEYGHSIGAVAPRNTVVNTVAPTGSISIIAGTSSGIEPYFALVFQRNVSVGSFLEVVSNFRDALLSLAADTGVGRDVVRVVFDSISRHKGSLRWALDEIRGELGASVPEEFIRGLEKLARVYSTSMDFDYWYHVAHNAAAQLYVDQSISKTVNLPRDAGERDVEAIYILGWLLGLRGVTIYRDESKMVQVIDFGGSGRTGDKRFVYCEKRRGLRMGLPKKNASNSEVLVMGEDENSTCKTCEL